MLRAAIATKSLFAFLILFLFSPASSANSNNPPSSDSCINSDVVALGDNVLSYLYQYSAPHDRVSKPKLIEGHISDQANQNAFFKQMQSLDFAAVSESGQELVLGDNKASHWLRLCITNQANRTKQLVLKVEPAITAEVDFYPEKLASKSFQTGNAHPMSTRDIYSATFDFNIELDAGETQQFYLRIKSRTKAYIRASLLDRSEYLIEKDKNETLDGLFFGVFLGLILYTILLFVSARQSSSLLYILWCFSVLSMFTSIDGRVLQYLLPTKPILAYQTVVVFYPLSVLISAAFTREFINLKSYPRLDLIAKSIAVLFITSLLVAYQFSYAIYFKTCAFYALIVILYLGIICPIYSLVAKHSDLNKELNKELSKLYLIALSPLILTTIDRAIFALGITREYLVPYTPKVGLIIGMVLMAYFLGLKTHKEKNRAKKIALQKELEAKKLSEIDQVKSEFFANISHEFRTPLTLIQGPLNDLLQQHGLQDKNTVDKDIIKGAIKQSKNLQTLVDQLLMLSKSDENSLSLKTSNMNVSDALSFITSQFSSLAESKQITLQFNTKAPDVYAYLDLEKLRVMLNNLLSNALKFTDKGGQVVVDVSTTCEQASADTEQTTDEYVVIKVSDTGHGIPEDELGYVFDRFYQSSSSAAAGSGSGTGIGLALVKKLALLHGGGVEVEQATAISNTSSSPVSGSIFSLRIPLGSEHLNPNEIILSNEDVHNHTSADATHSTWLSTKPSTTPDVDLANADNQQVNSMSTTVLVVDDNKDMRTYIGQILAPHYQIKEAADGFEAEQQVKAQAPDLIITDLMMPKRNGIEFVESLKNNLSFDKIPVIMLTARAGIEDRLDGLIAAVDDYMTKPFDARELKIRVENLLKKHAQFKAFYDLDAASIDSLNTKNGVDTKEGDESESISKIRSVIEDNISDTSFGVNELADKLHISRATLRRRLLEETKFTPSEFLRHCRLEIARQLSNQGQVSSIKELAASVGFSQASYFSRLYQKTFNTVPMVKRSS